MAGTDFSAIDRLIDDARARGGFPAAALEIGSVSGPLHRRASGRLVDLPDAVETSGETIFDLASLTKVIATTSLVMQAVAAGLLGLDDRVSRWLPSWRAADRADVTIRDLLEHASGLPGWRPLYLACTGRLQVEAAIAATPLEVPPRTRAIYSDLGFMTLGFLLEEAAGAPLDRQFARLGFDQPLRYLPPPEWADRTAPTERDPWRGRLLVGEVHDENCAALGGVAGHAGLFGSAEAVGAFARLVLQSLAEPARLAALELMRAFVAPSSVPGSSRALGWDLMRPTSSCGTRLSPDAFGHTGFTGTSLWIDPSRDLYVVFLTNRVYPTRPADATNDVLARLRPRLHDVVIDAIES